MEPSKTHSVINLESSSFDWTELVYEFFADFRSEHTRKAYQNDVVQFFEWAKDAYPQVSGFEQFTRAHGVAYKNWLGDSDYTPKSIARKMSAVSRFFVFLLEKEIVNQNPLFGVRRPRQEVTSPTYDLSDEEVEAVLYQVDNLSGSSAPLHRLVLYFLFFTGIRKSELIHLKRGDIQEVNGQWVASIKAKGGKILEKLLAPELVEVLFDYLNTEHENSELASDKSHLVKFHDEEWLLRPTRNPLEPSNLDKPLNPKSIDYIVKKYVKAAGIHRKIKVHSTRATFIGSALDQGHDIYRVAREVGHSSVKTTETYHKRRTSLRDSPVKSLGYTRNKGS